MDADIARLDLLLTLSLPEVHAEDGTPAIKYADIPPNLLSAFERFHNVAARPTISGEVCVWRADWKAFLHHETHRQHASMHSTSLERGAVGPSADDLSTAPLLSNWIVIRDTLNGGVRLVGTPNGHPTCQGPIMRSSRLCGLDPAGTWARTISRWFRLEQHLTAATFSKLHGTGVMHLVARAASVDDALSFINEDRLFYLRS